jgi:hypothetical protein
MFEEEVTLAPRLLDALQIRHLPPVWQHDFDQAEEVRSVPGSMTAGGNHVANLDRVFVPTADPAQHAGTSGFAGPFFDLAFIVFHIQENLHVRIDELEIRHGSLDGHDCRRVVVRLPVMGQEPAGNEKNAQK